MGKPRRLGRRLVVGTLLAATVAASGGRAGIAVTGGSMDQRAMATWAVDRFREHGLALPSLEIRFHQDREGCRGRTGHYDDGVVDVCRVNAPTDDWAARELLHEMAHAWLEANVTGAARDRFLRLRGLSSWNDPDATWEARGFEHGAEILAWAVGGQADGTRRPSIPDNEPGPLARAFEVLTGTPLPAVRAADRWVDPAA